MTRLLLVFVFVATVFQTNAQTGASDFSGPFGDETRFYAETKQVGQFLRRFNGEEGKDGERFYQGNPLFQDPEFRRAYLQILFDNETSFISSELRRSFTADVTREGSPILLDFHGPDWFAEVQCSFSYYGESMPLTLFMKLEADRLGHKWVISKVKFGPYFDFFASDKPIADDEFLHPLSHELDFMNLSKVFRKTSDLGPYTSAEFQPDQLTIFLMDVRKGALAFEAVSKVQFHFLQVDGWYFRLNEISRAGLNTGWLMTDLQRVDDPANGKALFEAAIYQAALR